MDVDVEEAYAFAVEGECDGEVGCDGAFADATFAGEDEDLVSDAAEAVGEGVGFEQLAEGGILRFLVLIFVLVAGLAAGGTTGLVTLALGLLFVGH